MNNIGRRIVVYGPTGSGKATVARQISRRISVPCVELDAINWQPNWVEKPLEEFRAEVSAILNSHTDGWVCDGNYSRVRDLILPLADTVVWLRLPFRITFWRLLKRTLRRSRNGEQLWGTNRESMRQSFLSRNSLLLYALANRRRYHPRIQRALEGIPHNATVFELRSVREIEMFFKV
ncbi:adenylate kinase [Chloroflexota bacterium]